MSKNQFFGDAHAPMAAIVDMFIHLKNAGVLPPEMREALRRHAENNVTTIPENISAIARSMAVSGSEWMSNDETSRVAFGIAELADQLNGYQLILDHL